MRDGDFRFSPTVARKVLRFVERYATHVEGELAGQPIVLERWQRLFLVRIFGWLRPDGSRRYRKVFLAVPRKNGKTTLVAVLALLLTCYDDEAGAQVYSAAGDRGQAALMFSVASRMVAQSPELSKRLRVFKRAITYEKNGSAYYPVSAEAKLKHGTNPSGVLFDELHVQPDEKLYEALNTGRGARKQPLFVMITTAGVFNPESLCWKEWQYAEKVRADPSVNPTYLAEIYGASRDDDWRDEKVWRRANPNFGVSVKEDTFREDFREALEDPVKENSFKRYNLNMWTEQTTRLVPMDRWDACGADTDEHDGEECYVGMDLSATQDVTALVLLFPKTNSIVCRFWIPEDTLQQRVQRDRVPYNAWVKSGHCFATSGNAVDHEAVREELHALAKKYSIKQVAYDPWNAHKLVVELLQDGLPLVECRQGFITLSAPTKDMLQKVLAGQYRHGGQPVLRWMAANVEGKEDEKGNLRLVKPKRNGPLKIDGIQALVMAQWAANKHEAEGPSVYETQGLMVI